MTSGPRLRASSLIRIVLAEGVSVAGDWVLITAASIQVFHETGSTAAVSALLAIAAVPTILLGPIGGAVADRHDRATLMVLADAAIAAVLLLAIAATNARFELATAYVAVLAAASSAAFHRPASEALVPALSGPEQIGRANSALRLATRIAMIGGPALAAFLMDGAGFGGVLAFDAGTFLVSGGLVLTVPRLGAPQGGGEGESAFAAALEGARYARRRHDLTTVIGAIGITMVMGAIISAGTLEYVTAELALPESRYGTLLAVEGAGAVALAVALMWLGPKLRLLPAGALALLGTGLACAALGFAPNLGAAMAVMAVMGMGEVGLQVCFSSYLQNRAEDAFRGRIMSLVSIVASLGRLGGLASAGPLVAAAGTPVAFAAAGTFIVLLGALPVAVLATSGARAVPVRA